ncbi:MAG: hypothetical protein Q9207_006461 [Kuettlingeria erythrocarpa]
MHAISMVDFGGKGLGIETCEHSRRLDEEKKHVAMLDAIALLLGYRQGDVAATGIQHEPNQLTLVWAKNTSDLPNNQDRAYLQNLATSFRELKHPEATLELVVDQCRRKILSRVKKLAKLFKAFSAPGTNALQVPPENDQSTRDLQQFLVHTSRLIDDVGLIPVLDAYVGQVNALASTSTRKDIIDVILLSYWLSADEHITLENLSPITRECYRQIKKVGAYYFAVGNVYSTLTHLDRRHPALRRSFAISQIRPPPTRIVKPYADTLRAMNVWTMRQNIPPVTDFANVLRIYPHANPGTTATTTVNVTASQHCELTIGLYLWEHNKRFNRTGAIEVGCNKASCWYCSDFIRSFNDWRSETQKGPRIMVRGDHSKHVDGWTMPAGTPDEVQKLVLNSIGQVMHTMINIVQAPPRKSDSHSPPSRAPWPMSLQETFQNICAREPRFRSG